MLHHEATRSARFIQPEKPWQNEFIESFHSTLRRNHLDVDVFYNLLDAELKTSIYTTDTNHVRPHAALGYKAPADVATIKPSSLMVSLGYQVGADLCLDTERIHHPIKWEKATDSDGLFQQVHGRINRSAITAVVPFSVFSRH